MVILVDFEGCSWLHKVARKMKPLSFANAGVSAELADELARKACVLAKLVQLSRRLVRKADPIVQLDSADAIEPVPKRHRKHSWSPDKKVQSP